MTTFWLATFLIDPPADDSVLGPIAGAGTTTIAVEVLHEDGDWAVLISSADDLWNPSMLTCLIGFANSAKGCSLWLDRGFPLVDARIDQVAGALNVIVPLFSDQPVMRYDAGLLTIRGLVDPTFTVTGKEAAPVATADGFRPCYKQQMVAPDGAQPDVLVTKGPISWTPARMGVLPIPIDQRRIELDVVVPPSRCPSLAPLQGLLLPTAAWTGELVVPARSEAVEGPLLMQQPTDHGFGVPAFRFEDVEVLGFRIDLSEYDKDFERDLERLVAPLNFHLNGSSRPGGRRRRSTPGFRYRAATSVLIIELLRYGRMKARVPTPPLSPDDSQSQHELVVRLLVGRVDDDSAQAHAPAMFVPAVFVDNPWSKVLGRDAIGYDKRMAEFCLAGSGAGTQRLLPDGRLAGSETSRTGEPAAAAPLGNISHINLVQRTGEADGPRLVDFGFSSRDHTDPDAFGPIDLSLTLGSSGLAGTRWRQSDFDAIEFRRSFASLAVADGARAFRCIQVAPVAERGTLEPSWVTGTVSVDPDMRVALPTGIATLTLHAVRNHAGGSRARSTAPRAWNQLCEMLGDGHEARLTAAGGNWYRLLCSMDLTIDDGLDWGTLGS